MIASLDGNTAAPISVKRRWIMTSFAHVEYPTQHAGVIRMERAVAVLRALVRYLRAWLYA